MKPRELKYALDELYGFNIARKSRKSELVYAKKVFITLMKDYGYRWKHMVDVIGLSHDNCIFHYKTFGDIKPIDLSIYNTCIDVFELPMIKYPSVSSINGNPLTDEVILKMKGLGFRDLKYFNEKLLDPFLFKLEEEKQLKQLTNDEEN